VVLGFDLNAVTTEKVQCVFRERAVKHGEDLGGYVVDRYFDVGDKSWVELSEIFVAEVEEFGCKFDAGC
jgi:hypothetical protein